MHIELSTSQVVDTLLKHEVLGQRSDSGVVGATMALVDWLEHLEEETDSEMSLDPVALRCGFSIYTLNDAAEMWDIDTSGASEGEERDSLILQYLRDRTAVIEVSGSTVILEEF